MPLTPAIFLDRDGTLMEDVEYCKDPAKVRLFPGVIESLKTLKAAGFQIIIITNQSGIGRGWLTVADYEAVHARLLALLGPGLIDTAYFCPDAPNAASDRRKPAPGMVHEAQRDHAIDLSRSWFIGDKAADVQCGINAGCHSILVRTGEGRKSDPAGATYVADDLAAATNFILNSSGARLG